MGMAVEHIPDFVRAFQPIVDQYGYFAVGGLLLVEDFGIPVPGETTLIAAALFAGLGQLNILLVIVVGLLGAIIGDNIGFAIGHFGGHPLIEKYGKYVFLTPQRFAKAEAFFNRHGGKIVVVARFIDGLRQANGIIAGVSEMKWRRFLIFNVIGALLWVVTWALVGYYGGTHIQTFLHYQLYITIGFLVAVVCYFVYRRYRKASEAKS